MKISLSDYAFIREESSRRLRRERGRKLRRYLLIGLATVGGGTVIGDYGHLKHLVSYVELIIKSLSSVKTIKIMRDDCILHQVTTHFVIVVVFLSVNLTFLLMLHLTAISADLLFSVLTALCAFARCDRWACSTLGGSRGQCCAGGWRGR